MRQERLRDRGVWFHKSYGAIAAEDDEETWGGAQGANKPKALQNTLARCEREELQGHRDGLIALIAVSQLVADAVEKVGASLHLVISRPEPESNSCF